MKKVRIHKTFWILTILIFIYFLWSEIWIDTILNNPYVFFSQYVDENGFFGGTTVVFKITNISYYINIFWKPINIFLILIALMDLVHQLIDRK